MTIQELIARKRGDRTLAQLSADAGGKPSAPRFQQLRAGGVELFPDPETVRGIARALRVTEWTVTESVLHSLGLAVGPSSGRLERLLPPGVETLTDAPHPT